MVMSPEALVWRPSRSLPFRGVPYVIVLLGCHPACQWNRKSHLAMVDSNLLPSKGVVQLLLNRCTWCNMTSENVGALSIYRDGHVMLDLPNFATAIDGHNSQFGVGWEYVLAFYLLPTRCVPHPASPIVTSRVCVCLFVRLSQCAAHARLLPL